MSLAFKNSGIKYEGEKDHSKVARFVEVKNFGPTMASQASADEVDINKIMARVQKGQTVLGSDGEPFYGDVSDLGGLQEALMKVQEAEDLFMQYPAEVREKFENNPVNMIGFLEDPANLDEAIKMGLIKPKPAPPTPPVPEPGAGNPA